LIGHGIPLLAAVLIGKCFRFLPSGEIYHPPSANECIPQGPKDEDCCVTHVVVIHGSGVAMPECKLSVQGNLVAPTPCVVLAPFIFMRFIRILENKYPTKEYVMKLLMHPLRTKYTYILTN